MKNSNPSNMFGNNPPKKMTKLPDVVSVAVNSVLNKTIDTS